MVRASGSSMKTTTRVSPCFFFNDAPTAAIYTLSLHDALPIYSASVAVATGTAAVVYTIFRGELLKIVRSEEHTSELQSRLHLVCRLLLEKKKTRQPAAAPPAKTPHLTLS